jgi:DNA-binding GntR family transcriptional regulator
MVHPADKRRVEQALDATKNMYGAGRLMELRERTGLGLESCKRIVQVEEIERMVENLAAGDGEALRRVLKRILELVR